MKKLIVVLALLLLALLPLQAAGAASSPLWYKGDASHLQDENLLYGDASPKDTPFSYYTGFHLALSEAYPGNNLLQGSLEQSFFDYYNSMSHAELESGFTRKMIFVDMKLTATRNQQTQELPVGSILVGGYRSSSLYPLIPLNAFVSAGTNVKNIRIFHGGERFDDTTDSPIDWNWSDLDCSMYSGKPSLSNGESFSNKNLLSSNALLTCTANTQLQFRADYGFSPFVIVWDEKNTDSNGVSVPDANLPATGDSTALLGWLALLGGVGVMVLLRRRISRA